MNEQDQPKSLRNVIRRVADSPRVQLITAIGVCAAITLWIGSLWPGVVDGNGTPDQSPRNYPIITEISPNPLTGKAAWVELANRSSDDSASLTDLRIGLPGSEAVEIDGESNEIPESGHLVICFDRVDGDDDLEGCPDLADNLIHRSSAVVATWLPSGGQIALLEASVGNQDDPRLIDFLAWGRPATGQLPNGDPPPALWRDRWVMLAENAGIEESDAELAPGEGIGLQPGGRPGSIGDWSVYTAEELSGGDPNSAGAPKFASPPNKTTVRLEDATIVWLPKIEDHIYCIRIKTVPPTVSTVIPAGAWKEFLVEVPYFRPFEDAGLSPGTFEYQIRRDACESTGSRYWSISRQITLASLTIDPSMVIEAGPVPYAYQRKDTPMLCLEPAASPASGYAGCGEDHWNASHPPLVPPRSSEPSTWTCNSGGSGTVSRTAPDWGSHGANHCVRACISMLVKAYGGCLSQDRIAHEYLRNPSVSPDYDLDHNLTTNCSGLDSAGNPTGGLTTSLLIRAFGLGPYNTEPDLSSVSGGLLDFHKQGLGFTRIKTALEAQRPLMSLWKIPGGSHMRVIDAVIEDGTDQWIRVLDPFAGGPQWRLFNADQWNSAGLATWECPPIGSSLNLVGDQEDEKEAWKDRDRDGIVNYDESERFFTNPKRKDSDRDRVPDLNEIAGYVFYPTPVPTGSTIADFDRDGVRKERDNDNDGDGCRDGQEDTNYNGILDPDERYDCFKVGDCQPALCGFFGCSCGVESPSP